MSSNLINPDNRQNLPEERKQQQKNKKNIKVIIAVVLAVQVVLAFFVGRLLFINSYQSSKDNTVSTIRKSAYDTVYNQTEEAYHVSNRATVSLDGIREKADLGVLEVQSCYLYKSDDKDRSPNLSIWYKIPGTGTFTVDMRMTEFIVDNERQHVLVKAPAPAITQFRENYEGIEELRFQNNSFLSNGSIKEGTELARKMLAQAHVQLVNRLEMTQAYYQAAQESATKLITNMIKAMNPDMSSLTVDVVFVN